MGLKVNLFMAFFAVLGFYNLPSFFFFLIYFCLMILYNYWKNWQFLSKFPGGKKISLSGIFLNSPNEFYDYVEKLWNNYGKDKFVLWIGFERIVAVSKLDDIKTVLDVSGDGTLIDNFNAMWPWIGCDLIKENDFSCEIFTNVIKSNVLNELTKSPAFVEHMSKRFGALCKHNIASGDVVDIQNLSRMMMFDILVLIATGNNVGPQRKEMLEEAEILTSLTDEFIYSGLKQSTIIRKLLFNDTKFSKSRANFIKHIEGSLSMENNLIENSVFKVLKQQNSHIDAATFITIFIILGYDRFSVAFTSLILELAIDSKLQEELCKEIRENKRYFMTCKNLEKFLIAKMVKIPVTPIAVKRIKNGIPLKGFFIPPNVDVLLFLQNIDTYGQLIKEMNENMTMSLMKLFVGEFVVRCKFQFEKEKNEEKFGCGMSLRRKSARILVRNRY